LEAKALVLAVSRPGFGCQALLVWAAATAGAVFRWI